MQNPEVQVANGRLARRLLFIAIGMFGFGFALVPLYNVFCDITGLNGKTGRIALEEALTTQVDEARWVTVEFVANVNSTLSWDFRPEVKKVRIHPGAMGEAAYVATNRTPRTIIGQAVPSVAPGVASLYFNKTECFCFTQQMLAPGETKRMLVRFVVDPGLPSEVTTMTLSYTFFEVPEKAVARAGPPGPV